MPDSPHTAPVQDDDAERYPHNLRVSFVDNKPVKAIIEGVEFAPVLSPTPDTGLIEALRKSAIKVVELHDEVVNCTRPGGVDSDEYDDAFEHLRALANAAPAQVESGK